MRTSMIHTLPDCQMRLQGISDAKTITELIPEIATHISEQEYTTNCIHVLDNTNKNIVTFHINNGQLDKPIHNWLNKFAIKDIKITDCWGTADYYVTIDKTPTK